MSISVRKIDRCLIIQIYLSRSCPLITLIYLVCQEMYMWIVHFLKNYFMNW